MKLVQICSSVEKLDVKRWNSIAKENYFLQPSFLKHFEKLDANELQPLYILGEDYIIYGHLITIKGEKVVNYLNSGNFFSLKKAIIRHLNFSFFCFGNTHFSNEKTIQTTSNKPLSAKETKLIIDNIKREFGINFYLFPDHFYKNIDNPTFFGRGLTRVNIDPDMYLPIAKNWTSFNYYINDLSSKYKKRTRKIITTSSAIKIKQLSKEELNTQLDLLKSLYKKVYRKSSFSGPEFDLSIYLDFMKDKFINFSVFGFYLNKVLIGFSSEIITNSALYSYFIGLDYTQNKKLNLYNRILYHTIENAIDKKVKTIKFGRTAAEFKSTVGAIPSDSLAAVYIDNKFLNGLFKPFVSRLQPKDWIQRKPFKK